MSLRKIAAANAVVFFVFWSGILIAGADKPPPVGFLWLILTVAICAMVVYWRIPTYSRWAAIGYPNRYWRLVGEGMLAGLIVATPFAIGGSGEPSVTMQPLDYILWFGMLAFIGDLNALALYGVNATLLRRAIVHLGNPSNSNS